MQKQEKNFVNIQQLIGLKLQSETKTTSSFSLSPALHLSSYDLVDFLNRQIQRSDHALSRMELNMGEVERLVKAKKA